MKCWTILALLIATCAVFLGARNTEETATLDDFEPQPLEDEESEKQLADSFEENPENDYDNNDDDEDENEPEAAETDSSLVKADNALDSVNEAQSDDEDKPTMVKRAPLWGRRRFFRFRHLHRVVRRVVRKVCRWVYMGWHVGWKYKCRLINTLLRGDEESPRLTNGKAERQHKMNLG